MQASMVNGYYTWKDFALIPENKVNRQVYTSHVPPMLESSGTTYEWVASHLEMHTDSWEHSQSGGMHESRPAYESSPAHESRSAYVSAYHKTRHIN